MSQLIPFDFRGQRVRTQEDADGERWCVAKDVCDVLGLRNYRQAVQKLDEDEKGVQIVDTLGGPQEMVMVNESGVYELTWRSRKPGAREFKRWAKRELFPQVLRTGRYEVQPKASDRFPELRAIHQLVESVAEARIIAEEAQRLAVQAEKKATLALAQQQWLTIRDYVYLHDLQRQCPERLWTMLGRYLSGYCREHGISVHKQTVGDSRWGAENAYHVGTMHELIPGWLKRQAGNADLYVVE